MSCRLEGGARRTAGRRKKFRKACQQRRQKTFYSVSLQICLAPWNITPTETEKKIRLIYDEQRKCEHLGHQKWGQTSNYSAFEVFKTFETEMPYFIRKMLQRNHPPSLTFFYFLTILFFCGILKEPENCLSKITLEFNFMQHRQAKKLDKQRALFSRL